MNKLSWVTRVPEVHSAVAGDMSGAVTEIHNDPDGETTAAIIGFAAASIQEAGEGFGLGGLERFTISGPGVSIVVAVAGDTVITAQVDPSKPLSVVEKKIVAAVGG